MNPYGSTLREVFTSAELWSKWSTVPNILTDLRGLVGAPLQLYLMIMMPDTIWPLVNFLFWSLTDFVDGQWARRYPNSASDLGKITDPLADKLLIFAVLAGVIDQAFGGAYAVWMLALIIIVTLFTLVRDIRVTMIKWIQFLKTGNFESAIQEGRIKMVVQVIVLLSFMIPTSWLAGWHLWFQGFQAVLIVVMTWYTAWSWRAYEDEYKLRQLTW